jgi:hypothetical protein
VLTVALGWKTFGAIAGALILFGGVVVAIRELGSTASSVKQRLRPGPPRFDLQGAGGQSSHQRDEATGEITWTDVRPSITIRNNEPVAVYAVTVGIVNPAGDERIDYPGCPIPVLKAETQLDLGSTEQFKTPSNWLAGVAPGNEHQGAPYFVTLTDANDRKWDGVIDFRETIPRLRLRRI